MEEIEKYNKEQIDRYEKVAIILGYLARTFNKISLANFNKLWTAFGYDRVSRDTLEVYTRRVEETPEFSKNFQDALDGYVSVEDLEDYNGETITTNDTIHNIISPYQVQHQRVLANNREFSRLQREGAAMAIFMEDLKESMIQELSAWEVPVNLYVEPAGTKNTMLVFISDWHIGASIASSYQHGGYNFSMLQKRLNTLLKESRATAELHGVEQIVCLFLGDLVEGGEMRGNQKWGLEFTLAQQVSKGTSTLLDFLTSLEEIAPVTFGAVKGNHDRLTGQANKKDQIYNDHAMYIVLDTLINMQDAGVLPNTTIIDNREDMSDVELTVYGRVIHGNHGEGMKITESQVKRFVRTGPVNYLITGHVHHSKIMQDDRDHLHIIVGSPMGYNDYSKSLNLAYTDPSQTLMILPEQGDPTIKTVFLAEGGD